MLRAQNGEAILQRVHSASVTVEKQLVSQIGKGILVLAAVGKDDTAKEAETLAAKVLKMKLWDDEAGGRVRASSSVASVTRSDGPHPVEEKCGRHRRRDPLRFVTTVCV